MKDCGKWPAVTSLMPSMRTGGTVMGEEFGAGMKIWKCLRRSNGSQRFIGRFFAQFWTLSKH